MSARSPYLASGIGHAFVLTGLLAVSALHRPPAIVPGVRIVTLPGGPRHAVRSQQKPAVEEKQAPEPPPPVRPAAKPLDKAPVTREPAKPPDPKGAKPARKPEVVSKTPTKTPPAPPSTVMPRGPVVVPGPGTGIVGFEAEGDPGPLGGYLELLRDKVASNWAPPPSVGTTGAMSTVVYFVIPRAGGEPEQVAVQSGSGSSFFDRAAMSAVLTSAPLQPLPSGWPKDSIEIKFTFQQEY